MKMGYNDGGGRGNALLALPLLLISAPYLIGIALLLPISLHEQGGWGFGNYVAVFGRADYLGAIMNTFWVSLLVALFSMPIGLAAGLFIAGTRSHRSLLMALILLPWMVSVVVRSYGWTVLLSNRGILNTMLAAAGIAPMRLMFEVPGVVIGLVHVFSPFVVLSVMAGAMHQDPALKEASYALGARPVRTFFQVTLPLVTPHLLTSTALVFLLSCGAVVTPRLLGGTRARMIGQQIYQNVFEQFDLVKASVLSVMLLGLTLLIVLLVGALRHLSARRTSVEPLAAAQAEPAR